MKLIFMGSPDFSVPALEALVEAGHEVLAVYSQPPRPAGRGKKDRPTAVHKRAEELGLPVRTPLNFKAEETRDAFAALNADIAVVVAYGLILPQAVLDAPAKGCLNIHASLLPRWRGAAPIHRAIMAGDAETGISIMQMEAGLDTGPVLLRKSLKIGDRETTQELHDRLSDEGGGAIVAALDRLALLTPEPQDDALATYATKIDKSEAKIDWTGEAVEISRQIRGLSPFPGAWTTFDGGRIKCLGVEIVDGAGEPGEILDSRLTIACGAGAVRLLRLQREGKKAQTAEEVLRGWSVQPGDRLGD